MLFTFFSPLTVLSQVEQGFIVQKTEPEILSRIAWCESRNDPTAKNPYSSASGRFQILKGTWDYYASLLWEKPEEHSVFDYDDNTAVAELIYEKESTKPWNSSKSCWSR